MRADLGVGDRAFAAEGQQVEHRGLATVSRRAAHAGGVNPTQNSGPFYDAFKDPNFNKITISAYDVPNVKERRQVIPGLVTHDWVEELERKYGRDSDIFKVRVLGEFPKQASDTLISIDAIEHAISADRELQNQDDECIGLDVARFGDDDSAFVHRKGNIAKVLEVYNGNSLMETAGKAVRYLKEYPDARLSVDVVGMGAGVYDRLKEQPSIRSRVYGVNSAGKPRDEAEFLNIRIESWVNVRNWLRDAILEKHESWYQLAMTFTDTIRTVVTGEPRIFRRGGQKEVRTAHRLPSSGIEPLAFRILGVVGATAILVAHYRPEVGLGPDSNILLDGANTVVVGLINAFSKLGDIAESQSLDVPFESLRGWLLALLWLGGVFAFIHSGLLDLYTFLTNREQVRVTIDQDEMSVRHSVFRFPKRIARDRIAGVLILESGPHGHDVMIQHDGGLTRIASIYGGEKRPMLLKLRLEQALAETSGPAGLRIDKAA